ARGPVLRAALVRLGTGTPERTEHLLLLTVHHIAFDGWSAGVFLDGLSTLYRACVAPEARSLDDVAGREPELPELPVQYADFAVWQRQWLRGEVLERQLAYWREQLAGLPVLDLPTDRPRPAVQSFRGTSEPLRLPAELGRQLRALGREHGTTLFMTLLAAFQALLGRTSGQADLAVGTPIAGRTQAELEGLLGFFVNTLVLRGDLSGDPSVGGPTYRELLARVRETALGAYAHQDVPFEQLVEALDPERDLSQNPLAQVLFLLQNAPIGAADFGSELRVGIEDVATGEAKFDLTLSLVEGAERLSGALEYNVDLFDRTTILRLLGSWRSLLAAAVADPQTRLSDLPLTSAAQRQQLVREWNDTRSSRTDPQAATLQQLIEAQVEKTPEAIAVEFAGERLSYRELNRRANQLAHHLRRLGVGGPASRAEVPVGICAERSSELVVGLVGILKAGGAYLPLDPTYPAERLSFMAEASELRVLLTQERLLPSLPELADRVVCLDTGWAEISAQSSENPSPAAASSNLAYVIYTSGSTGRPKGSMIPHRGIVNRLLWMQEAYGLEPGEGVLQKTPFSFDVSVWEFFWPLLVGARLVVARPGGHQDGAYLAEVVAERAITTMHFVPSMLQAFVEEPRAEDCDGLRRVIASGEALPPALQERFFSCLGAELHNLYGPTEASVDVTFWACQRAGERSSVPIGRPIANTEIYLLDRGGHPAAVGVAGELHIGGVGLARGYLGRPDLTAERFVPDPWSRIPGGRLYRTGDLARFRPAGAIEFLGRIDFQIKIRGFRIELGEIEAALGQSPWVRECVVVAREHAPGDHRPLPARLVAYAVTEGRGSEQELRAHLKQSLPEYMVPAAVVLLDALPLSPNGKVDRKALPAPEPAVAGPAGTGGGPRDPIEEILAEIFAQLLGLERVGTGDDFFALGGHSLAATQM
ncbi:MAG: amino acid adenylation domain-containing protein, partial [bacterium]|nr:amino acid adenylation domain-containing protein [bacterium]